MDNCIFCKIVQKKAPATIVYEDDEIMAFPSITPQAPVHILIIPKRHIKDVNALKDSDAELVGKLILVGRQLAKENNIDHTGYRLAFNIGLHGGQTVHHLHLHLLGGKMLDESG